MNQPDAMLVICALSQVPGRSRREWKGALETLRLLDVSYTDLVAMSASDAWKWLGWTAGTYREWAVALEASRVRISAIEAAGVSVVSLLDVDAPAWLTALPAAPWVFYRGDLAILDRVTLGFSGQREAGEESLSITSALATDAARLDFCVVSGGARGIDMAAHSAALNAGGTTAVILPQGLVTWTPPHALANPQWAKRMLAISEDLPWDTWNTDCAMRRNRMIVDLSRIFTVPQSGTSGGSHSTGRYALRQGRVTFVPDLGPRYPGNQVLLQNGARLLRPTDGRFDLSDMLEISTPAQSPTQTSLF